MSQSSRILVTGSGGRLGRLLRAARDLQQIPTAEIMFQSRGQGADLRWSADMPLGDLPACSTLVALWGVTGGDATALAQNEALVDLTVKVARQCGARRVLHLSTAAVYGPGTALHETSDLCPANAYGASKARMEARIARLRPEGRCEHIVLRLANVVGADSLAPALHSTGPVTLDRFENGEGPRRSYIGTSDLLRVIRQLDQLPPDRCPPILNVAATEPVGMAELIRAASLEIRWQPAPAEAVQDVTLDANRLARLLAPVSLTSDPVKLVADWKALETRE